MRAPETIEEVVRFGLCAGCGLCESLGGRRLPMRLNEEGYLRPSPQGDIAPTLRDEVLAACPGVNQRGPDMPRRDAVWGPYEELHLGYATDPTLRHAASSAGVCTLVAAHLLACGKADAVLHVGADAASPVRSVPRISRSPAEVVANVGARYGPVGPIQLLHRLLDEGARIVVLAKPCDISAVRNLARRDPRIARQVVATISFLCAGLPSHSVSRRIIGKYDLDEQEVSLLRYRGNGCPGPTRIETKDGRVFEQTYNETWSSDLTQGVQFRCKICPDSTGEQADLVCCDAWEGAEGYPIGDGAGYNGIIVRTRQGRELLGSLRTAGLLRTESLTLERLADMQPHQARRKRQVLGRLLGLALSGQLLPRYRGLGLIRAALQDLGGTFSSLRGMVRRVRLGRNRELLPHPVGHDREGTPGGAPR